MLCSTAHFYVLHWGPCSRECTLQSLVQPRCREACGFLPSVTIDATPIIVKLHPMINPITTWFYHLSKHNFDVCYEDTWTIETLPFFSFWFHRTCTLQFGHITLTQLGHPVNIIRFACAHRLVQPVLSLPIGAICPGTTILPSRRFVLIQLLRGKKKNVGIPQRPLRDLSATP